MKVRIVLGVFDRWIIVQDEHPELAWTGSRWVSHAQGISNVAQVSNFYSLADAVLEANRAGFEIILPTARVLTKFARRRWLEGSGGSWGLRAKT